MNRKKKFDNSTVKKSKTTVNGLNVHCKLVQKLTY